MSVLKHAAAAEKFIANEPRTDWHDETLWFVREKRDRAAHTVPGWEQLRELASEIKNHTLSNLDVYLSEFCDKAEANGVTVHFAADAAEHNRIILDIIRANNIERIVKSKSMLTEECHLNETLIHEGIEVVDTDLGERIVQLRKEAPSHIVLPAIHLKKEDVSTTFHEHLHTQQGNNDPQYLTEAARQHLRDKFIQSQLAITGVNFAIAETGGFVVCTNEGNADMGANAAAIHIACMGIEKIIPRAADLGVFLRLLARSATGQPITTYSSHFHKPRAGQQMHIVIVDNGRTRQLGREDFRNSLKCIRCAACFNTCPVYRKSGGHSYHNAVAGPIGAILSPNIDMEKNADLPFASTLC
ncbi:MAG: lactate utilization protein, partial [Chitinophagaceae bacterium]